MGDAVWALGLMSGTSMDGIDVALIATDGESVRERGPGKTYPYPRDIRDHLRAAIAAAWRAADSNGAGAPGEERLLAAIEGELTEIHATVVKSFLATHGIDERTIECLGFHGQTVLHDPSRRLTRQLGDGPLLAEMTGIDVVCDFRSADVAAGGQGAPFVPIYHRALVEGAALEGPVVVLNLGGVANVTWIGRGGALVAFDTGPGNALLDDWVLQNTGQPYDAGGAIAAQGKVDPNLLARLLAHAYFDLAPPKSLDRMDFTAEAVQGLSLEDGAATLVAFSAASIAKARRHLPEPPKRWIACGGGTRNPTLMRAIAERLSEPIASADALDWSSDHMEAEAFAYLAVRSLRGLPLSFPGTTGVPKPLTGGRIVEARSAASSRRQ